MKSLFLNLALYGMAGLLLISTPVAAYECCAIDGGRQACKSPNIWKDCACEPVVACGLDANGTCGGYCSNLEDRYGELSRTQSCISPSSSTCECCPDDVIKECEAAGKRIGPGCTCDNNECGGSTPEQCGGTCPDQDDVCKPIYYRGVLPREYEESDAHFLGCSCCPQSAVDKCEEAGGTLGSYSSGSRCLCFFVKCDRYNNNEDGFYRAWGADQGIESGMCGGTCSDGRCVEVSTGNCQCCSEEDIENCTKVGGVLDERCQCSVLKCEKADDGTCGSTCAVLEDGTKQSCVSNTEGTCQCCPDSKVIDCQVRGGILDENCECQTLCGSTTDTTCTALCSDQEDKCTADANGKCRCCPNSDIADCQERGGILDENCACVSKCGRLGDQTCGASCLDEGGPQKCARSFENVNECRCCPAEKVDQCNQKGGVLNSLCDCILTCESEDGTCNNSCYSGDGISRECVNTRGTCVCCSLERVEYCKKQGLTVDYSCNCLASCEVKEDGTCGGTCSSDGRKCVETLFGRYGRLCQCCPDSDIENCQKRGGILDENCECQTLCGSTTDKTCTAVCSDLSDSCVKNVDGNCQCCSQSEIEDCESQGAAIDENCQCVCLLREPYPPSSSE